MLQGGWVDTTGDMDRWCHYIFYQGLQLRQFRRIPVGLDSDTEVQAASFALPTPSNPESD
jgi:hypothetical protein